MAGSSLAAAGPAAAGSAQWNTVARRGDVAVGKGIVVRGPDGQPWIVTRPEVSVYRAFSAICTHQGCAVSGVRRRKILCGCHGSLFNMNTGEVVRGPAQRPLEELRVRLRRRRIQVFG